MHSYIGDGRIVPNDDPTSPIVVITMGSILSFVTGSDTIPPLGFENNPEIRFDGDHLNPAMRLPSASTCGPTLYLPYALSTVELFAEKMDMSIAGAQSFGVI